MRFPNPFYIVPQHSSIVNISILSIPPPTAIYPLPKDSETYNMDSPPPPNNNNNDRSNALRAKEEAIARNNGQQNRNNGVNENGDVEMFNLQDNGLVVVMFLMSVASWMLRERCVC